MAKYKIGAIIKEVPKGAEKWYIKAGWKKIEELKNNSSTIKEEKENDKANSKETVTS